MFTVKLMKVRRDEVSPEGPSGPPVPCTFTTKLLEAGEVDIHTLRPGRLFSVEGMTPDGKSFAYYVADRNEPRPEGFAPEIDFYYAAFIENSAGATTEIVKF